MCTALAGLRGALRFPRFRIIAAKATHHICASTVSRWPANQYRLRVMRDLRAEIERCDGRAVISLWWCQVLETSSEWRAIERIRKLNDSFLYELIHEWMNEFRNQYSSPMPHYNRSKQKNKYIESPNESNFHYKDKYFAHVVGLNEWEGSKNSAVAAHLGACLIFYCRLMNPANPFYCVQAFSRLHLFTPQSRCQASQKSQSTYLARGGKKI